MDVRADDDLLDPTAARVDDDTDAVSGTFTGLAENATFTIGLVTYRISYTGGTGNDVVLTVTQAPFIVTNTNDSGAGSLRQALAGANDGDTISFGVTGTITLSTGELVVDKSLTINGPGSDNLTVEGSHASRVFHVSGGVRSATLTSNNSTDFFIR